MGALSSLLRARGLGHSAADWSSLAQQWGDYYGVDPALILAVIHAESSGDPNVLGARGESGLMQVKSATASWMLGRPVNAADLRDPSLNIQAGTAYLAWQQGRGYTLEDVISGYNAGTPTMANTGYVARVLAYLESLVSPAPAEAAEPVYEMEPIIVRSGDQVFAGAEVGGEVQAAAWQFARRYWPFGVAAVLLWILSRLGVRSR